MKTLTKPKKATTVKQDQKRIKAWKSLESRIKELLQCNKHPRYTGSNKPATISKHVGYCPSCWLIYTMVNNKLGIKTDYEEGKYKC